ncbi:ribonuclease P protein component [Candidatus Peregrinibacteria bacterium]|nr:MAG: ribonuclease P protein component [Candidatus Peregrinibacteria bacterium]
MLNKRHRLKSGRSIEQLFKNGRWFKTPHLLFKYQSLVTEQSLFAVSISKKLDKRATKRNRLRRQIHESIRTNPEVSTIKINALVIAKPEAMDAPFHALAQDVELFIKSLTHAKQNS